jgi:hypothetical protein
MLRSRLLSAAAALALGACASVDPLAVNREALAGAWSSLEAGKAEPAARRAEQLFAARAEEGQAFAFHRFYAAYVAARAHVHAALNEPFLSAGRPNAARNQDDVGHWVAAGYYIGFARDLAARARSETGKDKLLPASMQGIDVARASLELDLIRLAILSRFDFVASVEEDLARISEPLGGLEVEASVEAMERTGLVGPLRPWVLYALFRHHRANETVEAYRAGALARLRASELGGSLPPEREREIVEWTRTADYAFRCPKCQPDELRDPELLKCPAHPDTGADEFVPESRVQIPRSAASTD